MQGPMVSKARSAVDVGLAFFIATWFMIESLRVFLASVYAMNVLTVSLNLSIVAILFLLVPVVYLLGLARLRPRALVLTFALLFLALRFLMLVPWPVETLTAITGLAVASYFLFLVPFLASHLRLAGGSGTLAAAIALALGLDVALRTLGKTVDPGTSVWSVVFLLPLGAVFLYLLFRGDFPLVESTRPVWNRTVGLAGLGLGGFLSLSTIVLLYPAFVARWTTQAVMPILAAVLLGFSTGAFLVKMGLGPGRRAARWSGVLQGLLFVAAVDLSLGGSLLTFLLIYFASVASIVGLERILGALATARPSVRSVGWVVFLACAVYLVSLMAFVFTLTYAYVPVPDLWRGHALAVFLLIAATFVAPSLALGAVSPSAAPTVASRRWVTGTIAVILVLAAVGFVVNAPVAPSAVPSHTIRVMTYNVHQGFSAGGILDPARIVDAVRIGNPDVLALEESDTVRVSSGGIDLVSYLASSLGYNAAYGPPTDAQTYGVSILSRFPIKEWDWTLLPSPGDNRVVVHAYIAVGNVPLDVYAAHLGLNGTERDAQVAAILSLAEASTNPRILLGDFNSCPSGMCPETGATQDHVYARITQGWSDAWLDANPGPPVSWSFTYDAVHPFERIDYIFLAGGVDAQSCSVLGNVPPNVDVFYSLPLDASDHLPVVATVTLP